MKENKQIVVVEDDPADYELIVEALKQAGIRFQARRVDVQSELDEELLRLAPDLVLCDHASAKWDSFAVLGQVRAFESAMPFVVVSGALDEDSEAALRAGGVDGCVSKNHLDDLAPTVCAVLQRCAEQQREKVEAIRRNIIPLDFKRRRPARPALQARAS
jgi:DNA-binding response OmpR family regulator